MPKKSSAQRDAESRAEARRRARMLAQGRAPEDEAEEEDATTAARGPSPSLFQRIFPPAAPLPGKGDPLAGFTYTGRMRPLVANLWLIGRNPIAGIAMGMLWAVAYVITVQYAGGLAGTVASFVSFGSLIAAGWIGWQRPWLYGLVAAIIGYLAYAGFVLYLLLTDPDVAAAGPTDTLVAYLLTNGVLQAAIGALAGFYGGYLRRRIADPATRRATAARRRR